MPRFLPKKEGLYRPDYEHDACGVGFIAHLKGQKSHDIVSKGIELLLNLEHRGAVGAEHNSGDGAGILIQLPHAFFQSLSGELGFEVPEFGHYGVGQVFLPPQEDLQAQCREIFECCVRECGQEVLGWRSVPQDNSVLGSMVRELEPEMAQVFIKRDGGCPDDLAFERKLFVIRKYAQNQILKQVKGADQYYYVGSLSYKTVVYKGQLITTQLAGFFDDLRNPETISAIALVHSRFSTNTFPSWPLAQPFRYLAHNGEINTLRGNINWMRARQSLFKSNVFTEDEMSKILPILDEDGSDSAVLDNAIEFLTLAGRSLPHVMMMMIPEAWEKHTEMNPEQRAFYEFHATLMEPWDGPASVIFTDGQFIGATLDRNGLRPSRYCLTKDDVLVMASEQGALEFVPEDIVLKGCLQPGKMFLADLEQGWIVPDVEVKAQLANAQPYGEWIDQQKIELSDLPFDYPVKQPDHETTLKRQKCFGYSLEELRLLVEPMFSTGYEAIGSMGNDAPVAVLSDKSINLFNYFHQLFAQVTNPPIDPIREEAIMSLTTFLGPQGNILDEKDERYFVEMPQPLITDEQMARLNGANTEYLKAKTLPMLFDPKKGGLKIAVEALCDVAVQAVQEGHSVIVLSDHSVSASQAPIPSLLATSAVHHRLIKAGLRTQCGLVIETGEAREVHHFAVLIGYGANAINPYLVFESVKDMQQRHYLDAEISQEQAEANFIYAVGKGLLKIMSKMGISTVQSYMGAQIFEAVGLGEELIDNYFCGTASRIGGIGFAELEEETLIRHRFAYPSKDTEGDHTDIDGGGQYQWRQRGERHLFSPDVVHLLQRSVRQNNYDMYKQFTVLVNDQNKQLLTLRGLLDFDNRESISLDEVEPSEAICKRFATGAMSYGSISIEAHTTLAIAMNRIGGKSNTGEGGEDPKRFEPMENGDNACSAIKQVASGRFGVTSNYLVHSEEIQIKIAQGAKPGEGGQLPGYKVDDIIGKVRHSTPGVGLISPPPHHDIYSIEDLAQLIFDLKNSNTSARINVKLVSEVGVGTVATGVAKAHADVVLIAGYDGGTGASPQTSIKHAGLPWELGLAETHQTLVKNKLRNRIVVQTDGQIRTGRDLAIATLLGAEEWGVATAGLVAIGCIMMRKCHLNTCPVGIATQDKDLRVLYHGEADHVVNYFRFMAEELREIMAELGFRTVNEMVGRVDKLKARKDVSHWKAKTLRLEDLLHKMAESQDGQDFCYETQDHGLETALDYELLAKAKDAIESKKPVQENIHLRNINRTVGTILSAEVTRAHGEEGLAADMIHFKATGSGGQSLGAFSVSGVTFELEGDANDYFGKGMCGGRLILYPPKQSTFVPDENVIVGNVAFYGATSGESYIRGLAGERFCVRNSGVEVVVEAVGNHGCEYMTDGRVIILGEIGRNFAAGMSGGIAYIFDENDTLTHRINSGLVDLEQIEDGEESSFVKGKIQNHFDYTGSRNAERILQDWDMNKTKFIKVMPRDYKRVLMERQQVAAFA